jgi:catechol 2,3-dioxygenase-like lactoylglutathione lyase family enzyme
MPITHLEHFLVLTDDIEATRDFYRDALGLTVGPRPPLPFAGYWLYAGDVPCVHIAERSSYTATSRPAGIPVSGRSEGTGPFDHAAFIARNFDEVAARFTRHGVKAHLNIVPGIGLRQLFVLDPNGVKIEINVPAEPSSV